MYWGNRCLASCTYKYNLVEGEVSLLPIEDYLLPKLLYYLYDRLLEFLGWFGIGGVVPTTVVRALFVISTV